MIHPSAFIAEGAKLIGEVSLGEKSSVWYNAVLRADMAEIEIGDETNIQDLTVIHVDEGVPCKVGNRVGVGHGAILHGCTVEDGCLIGMGAVLLNHSRVGSGSVIGAGAVIPEGTVIHPKSLVLGVPGKVVRQVDQKLVERIEGNSRHYVVLAEKHRNGKFEVRNVTL